MNKTWIVGLLGYIAYFIKQFTGIDVPDEMINNIADIILLLIALIAMFANMKKSNDGKNQEHQFDDGPAV